MALLDEHLRSCWQGVGTLSLRRSTIDVAVLRKLASAELHGRVTVLHEEETARVVLDKLQRRHLKRASAAAPVYGSTATSLPCSLPADMFGQTAASLQTLGMTHTSRGADSFPTMSTYPSLGMSQRRPLSAGTGCLVVVANDELDTITRDMGLDAAGERQEAREACERMRQTYFTRRARGQGAAKGGMPRKAKRVAKLPLMEEGSAAPSTKRGTLHAPLRKRSSMANPAFAIYEVVAHSDTLAVEEHHARRSVVTECDAMYIRLVQREFKGRHDTVARVVMVDREGKRREWIARRQDAAFAELWWGGRTTARRVLCAEEGRVRSCADLGWGLFWCDDAEVFWRITLLLQERGSVRAYYAAYLQGTLTALGSTETRTRATLLDNESEAWRIVALRASSSLMRIEQIAAARRLAKASTSLVAYERSLRRALEKEGSSDFLAVMQARADSLRVLRRSTTKAETRQRHAIAAAEGTLADSVLKAERHGRVQAEVEMQTRRRREVREQKRVVSAEHALRKGTAKEEHALWRAELDTFTQRLRHLTQVFEEQKQTWQLGRLLEQCCTTEHNERSRVERDRATSHAALLQHAQACLADTQALLDAETAARGDVAAQQQSFSAAVHAHQQHWRERTACLVEEECVARAACAAQEEQLRRASIASFSRPLFMIVQQRQEVRRMELHSAGSPETEDEKQSRLAALRLRQATRSYVVVTAGPAVCLRDEYSQRICVEESERCEREGVAAYAAYFFWMRMCASEWIEEPPPLPNAVPSSPRAARRVSTVNRHIAGYLENVLLLQTHTSENADYFTTPPRLTLLMRLHDYSDLQRRAEAAGAGRRRVPQRLSGLELLQRAGKLARKKTFSEQRSRVQHGTVAALPPPHMSDAEVNAWQMGKFLAATATEYRSRDEFFSPEVHRAHGGYVHAHETHRHVVALAHLHHAKHLSFAFPITAAWQMDGCSMLGRVLQWTRRLNFVVKYVITLAACVPFSYIERLPHTWRVQKVGRGAASRALCARDFYAPRVGLNLVLSCMDIARGSTAIARILCLSGAKLTGSSTLQMARRRNWTSALIAQSASQTATETAFKALSLGTARTDSATTVQCAARVSHARHQRNRLEAHRVQQEQASALVAAVQEKHYTAAVLTQRIGRGCASRAGLQHKHLEAYLQQLLAQRRKGAARHIQSTFRGFAARNRVLQLMYRRDEAEHLRRVAHATCTLQRIVLACGARSRLHCMWVRGITESWALAVLQTRCRGGMDRRRLHTLWWERKTYKQRAAAATEVQRMWRGFVARNTVERVEYQKMEAQVKGWYKPVLQRVGLGCRSRTRLAKRRWYRRREQARRLVDRLVEGYAGRVALGQRFSQRREEAVQLLQRVVRGYACRRRRKHVTSSCVTIQRVFRGFVSRDRVLRHEQQLYEAEIRNARSRDIQRVFRGYMARRDAYEEEYKQYQDHVVSACSIDIQRVFRGFLARKRVMERAYAELMRLHQTHMAERIQAAFRNFSLRNKMLSLCYQALEGKDIYHFLATQIQRVYRGHRGWCRAQDVRKQLLERSTTRIQRVLRAGDTRQRFSALRHMQRLAGTVSRVQRAHCCRKGLYLLKNHEEITRRNDAVAVLNKAARGYLSRQLTWHKWAAVTYVQSALVLQRLFRVQAARRVYNYLRRRQQDAHDAKQDSASLRREFPIGAVVRTRYFDDISRNGLLGRLMRWQHPHHAVLCMLDTKAMSVVPMHCIEAPLVNRGTSVPY